MGGFKNPPNICYLVLLSNDFTDQRTQTTVITTPATNPKKACNIIPPNMQLRILYGMTYHF
jgi:hypothetical protein